MHYYGCMHYRFRVSRVIIDTAATSRKLKALRIQHGYEIKELQHIFGFANPVSIYAWESENKKSLPCLENLDLLSRLYGVHVEDLYVTREIDPANQAPEVWILQDIEEADNSPANIYPFPTSWMDTEKEDLPVDTVSYVF